MNLPSRRPVAPGWAPALLAVAAATPATAAPWYVEPSINLYAAYESNPQFYVDHNRSGSGEIVTVDAPLEWSDGASSAAVRPTANAGSTRGASGLGQHNRSLDGQGTYALETGSLRVSGRIARSDLTGAQNGDLGTVRPIGYVGTENYGAGGTWLATERASLDLDLNRSIVAYHAQPASFYVDYSYSQVTGQYGYQATERTQALTTVSYADYEPVGRPLGTRDHSVQFGGTHKFTDGLKLTATFGRSRVKLTQSGDFRSGTVYNASLTWDRPTTNFLLTARQSQQPGSIGDLALTTEVVMAASIARSDRLSYRLTANYARYDDSFASVYELSRRAYRAVAAEAHYQLAPQWRLDARVNWARSAVEASTSQRAAVSGESTGVSLGIVRKFGRTRLN